LREKRSDKADSLTSVAIADPSSGLAAAWIQLIEIVEVLRQEK
jgi:hypothetical protein